MPNPTMHRLAGTAVAVLLVGGACGGAGSSAPAPGSTTVIDDDADEAALPDPPPTPGPITTPAVARPTPEPELAGTAIDRLAAGPGLDGLPDIPEDAYVSELLTVAIGFEVPFHGSLLEADRGAITILGPGGFDETGLVAFLQPSRIPTPEEITVPLDAPAALVTTPNLDFGRWLAEAPHLSIVDQGEDTISDRPVPWWQVELDPAADPYGTCHQACLGLFETGPGKSWIIAEGIPQRIWQVPTGGAPIYAIVEAAAPGFDDWLDVAHPMVRSLATGSPTPVDPASQYEILAGPHELGQTEVTFVDESRTSDAVTDGDTVIFDAADSRTLEVTIGYPSDERGRDVAPAAGAFPLVIDLPGLHGHDSIDSGEEALIRQGYVVASIRFPESAAPGGQFSDYTDQPADVSFVIDQLATEGLPNHLEGAVDTDRVGLLGHSLGATTAYGLTGWSCCVDERVDAVVAHAGLVLPFAGDEVWENPPLLIVGSDADTTTRIEMLHDLADRVGAPVAVAEVPGHQHLDWLAPSSPYFQDVVRLTRAWFDVHLREADPSVLAEVVTSSGAGWTERS